MSQKPFQILANDLEAVKKFHITNDEFFELAYSLRTKHAIFHRVWLVGKPIFTMGAKTAGIQFSKTGRSMNFLFNPVFWTYLDEYTRKFVLCHEMLHVILNHGVRIKDSEKINHGSINACLDIVVNHLLVDRFGFCKQNLMGFSKELFDAYANYMKLAHPDLCKKQEVLQEKIDKVKKELGLPDEDSNLHGDYRDYCWINTIFDPSRNPLMQNRYPKNEKSFEYYYNLLPKVGMGGKNFDSFDSHGGLVDVDDLEDAMQKVNDSMTPGEKEDLEEMVSEHCQPNDGGKQHHQGAGTTGGNVWTFVDVDLYSIRKKKKWETIIKKWTDFAVRKTFKDTEQWARVNRRFVMIPQDFFLPTEMETEDMFEEQNKLNVFFYLDTSGSCFDLKERFFKAACSLPEKKFNVQYFCFDTKCYNVDIEQKKLYGFGGTTYGCIENHIQSKLSNGEIKKYPSAVFIMTDGYASDMVAPQCPGKWYFFLSADYTKKIPKESHTFMLDDFE